MTVRLIPAQAQGWRRRRGPYTGSPISPGWVMAITGLGAFLVSLDLSVVTIAFPAMHRSFPAVSDAALSWVLTAYAIVFAALLVPAGRIADRSGRRRVFLWGVSLFTAGSALCAFSPGLGALIAGRVIQGVGGAVAQPASLGLLLGVTPKQRQGRAVAVWAGISALAVVVSPTIGGLLIAGPGWRWVFTINLPTGIALCLVGRLILPESERHPTRGLPDPVGTGLIAVATAAVVLGISEGSDWGWASPRILACLLLGPALLGLVPARSRRQAVPAIDVTLFRSRAFTVANLATVLYAAAFFGLLFANIVFLTTRWHYSALQAGLAITPMPVLVALISRLSGALADRHGYRVLILCGGAAMAAGSWSLAAFVGPEPHYIAQWLWPTILLGVGVGLIFPVLGAAAVSQFDTDWAAASAVNQSFRQAGVALGVAVAVACLSAYPRLALSGYELEWLVAGASALAAGMFGLLIPARRRQTPSPELGCSGS